jgi:hypothetical protein
MSRRDIQDRHSAPGSAAGYTYQFGRALSWLAIGSGNFMVCIESLDDVSVEMVDGSILLEQDKYSTQETGNPISDHSVALWKTLSLWADFLIETDKQYKFLLVTNRPVTANSIIRRISDAETEEQISSIVQELMKIAHSPSDTIEVFCKKVCTCEYEVLRQLIKQTRLSSSDSAGTEWETICIDIITCLRLPTPLVDQSRSIINELLGWVIQNCMHAWQSRKPAAITSQAFFNALDRVRERRRRQRVTARSPKEVPITPDDLAGIGNEMFVEQLKLIDSPGETIDDAINDFIRYGKEVIRLTESGEYTPRDWEEFETELEARWKRIFERIQRLHDHEEERRRGERAYHETTTDYYARLKGESTEYSYFTSGAYHRLADELEVGWHPRFSELIDGKGSHQ